MHFKHICLITWYLTQANNKKTSRISVLISLNQLNCLKQIKSIRYMIELLFRRSFHIKIKDMVRTRCVMLVKCWLQADRHYMKTHVKMRPFTPFNSCNWTNTLFTSIIFQIRRGRIGKSYSDLWPSIYSTKNVSHMVVILLGKIHIRKSKSSKLLLWCNSNPVFAAATRWQ